LRDEPPQVAANKLNSPAVRALSDLAFGAEQSSFESVSGKRRGICVHSGRSPEKRKNNLRNLS
jgi:hypothetical protein